MWLLLDSSRSLWTKERGGPWSVEWGESVSSSSLDAGSESGRPINGEDPLVCLVVVPALAPSHLSRLT